MKYIFMEGEDFSDDCRIYVAELDIREECNLVYYHRRCFPYKGVNMSYLRGYIDGAFTPFIYRGHLPVTINRMPKSISDIAWDIGVRPLSDERFEELIEGLAIKNALDTICNKNIFHKRIMKQL